MLPRTKIRTCGCTAVRRTIDCELKRPGGPSCIRRKSAPAPSVAMLATLSCRWHPQGAHRQDFSPEESVHAQCECQAADTDESRDQEPGSQPPPASDGQ